MTYLVLISREKSGADGPVKKGVTIDVAFSGRVVRVDDMTGEPLAGEVHAEAISGGMRLIDVEAARIPGAIGQRAEVAFKVPVYRIGG